MNRKKVLFVLQLCLLVILCLVSQTAFSQFTHDVAVISVTPSDTIVDKGVSTTVNVTVENGGDYTETFNVTLYAEPQIPINETGLVGYWSFNELTGQTAYDYSSYGNNGSIHGASKVYGNLGPALSFDGEDDYVEVMHSASLNISSITVMAWVKLVEFPGYFGGVSMIVAKGTNDQQNGHFGLHQYYEGHTPTNPAIFHFYLRENDQWYAVDGNTSIVLGEWYHVAGTYNGSTLKVYVNGVLEDEETIGISRTYNTENLQIGALRMPVFEYWLNGTIDEVKLYNRALSHEEVLAHIIGSERIETETVSLNIDSSKTVSFMWNTTDIPLGNYTLTAYAEPVLGETHTTDNIETNGIITVIPEFPSLLILPLFMITTLLAVTVYRRRKHSM